MKHPKLGVVGVVLGTVVLGLATAPAASAAQGTFSYDRHVITNPINGNCYRLPSSTARPHVLANNTDTTAYVSTGTTCSGPQLVRIAPGVRASTLTAHGSVVFR